MKIFTQKCQIPRRVGEWHKNLQRKTGLRAEVGVGCLGWLQPHDGCADMKLKMANANMQYEGMRHDRKNVKKTGV